uniref:Uncharacterized protein n=1 Tax=Siphoviridae sp. ctRuT6 TaxID=2826339 RepID=A0A8S5N2P4_9CAUD|nr:MAG TPA: hypothetical protein [Siphoviridae sp. ctRuT6]DAF71098.1 MAG TPA: hypothetical protein [Caudoviricetes sp.]DAQ24561.1 MAG TPA: hypothetical protein [Caudoviricetes sp.]
MLLNINSSSILLIMVSKSSISLFTIVFMIKSFLSLF